MTLTKKEARQYAEQLNQVDSVIWDAILYCGEFMTGTVKDEGTIPYMVANGDVKSLKKIMKEYEEIRDMATFSDPSMNAAVFDEYQQMVGRIDEMMEAEN